MKNNIIMPKVKVWKNQTDPLPAVPDNIKLICRHGSFSCDSSAMLTIYSSDTIKTNPE